MLTNYFENVLTLNRLRSGPSGPYIEGFASKLHNDGYTWWTSRRYLRAAAHFGIWTMREGIFIPQITHESIEKFGNHLPLCTCPDAKGGKTKDAILGASHFVEYLHRIGVANAPVLGKGNETVLSPLHERFNNWMREHRGVTERTLEIYRPMISEFLDKVAETPERLEIKSIRTFILDRARRGGNSKAKLITKAIRMFLRYLASVGKCSAYLLEGIPSIANWRLSPLPGYLEASDVDRIIDSCDSSTAIGCRDRAIILLLARLGLRANDVVKMRLSDIDWNEACIKVSGKGRRESKLPLSQEVGDAILEYLNGGRPSVVNDHVFIRAVAPLRPLDSGSAVSAIVARSIRRVGITAPSHGAHVLRHSAATNMLREGVSLYDISVILRHCSVETTRIYTKVDVELLKEVVQPWPEVLQ